MIKRVSVLLPFLFFLISVEGSQKTEALNNKSEYDSQNSSCELMMRYKEVGSVVKELTIKNGNRNIYGVVSEPIQKDKKKVAIISHGFNGTHDFATDYYEMLHSLGYIVYGFDFPCGSINSRSDANTMNMSILDEKKDLESIVEYFEKRSDVDTNNIILIGESQGGLVSALAAADLKERISKLILIYPALCIPDNWNKRYPQTNDILDTTFVWKVPIGKRFFMELRDMNVYDMITRYNGPVKIIHGSKDVVVPLSYSEKVTKLYDKAQLNVITGAGHGFKPDERIISNKFIYEFLK
ncbi:alpha/beta hydrolase family protein [Phocaeicola paurosaccharolyticus]|uniref:alpha/beta hydrolase family protein n=1 Tax=Phocaeicola paurosaccharolyticus TaxID=732242 RepID=UPI00046ACD97|nr:alpha/beta fold hydrolase [Phocaeicola paurosaccharolyticus]